MPTEVISGTADGVRHTVHVSGDKDSVSTSHYTIFRIGDTTVMFTARSPSIISEGDRIVVAGRLKGQMLEADAYVNQTARIRGDAGLWAVFGGMIFFLVPASATLMWVLLGGLIPGLPPLDWVWKMTAVMCSGIFGAIGLYCLYRWRRIRGAVKLLKGV